MGESRPFGRENLFIKKEQIKQPFCVDKNQLHLTLGGPGHHVIFWGSPENFGVLRFRLAIGKVGGIKIEAAKDRQKRFCVWTCKFVKMDVRPPARKLC